MGRSETKGATGQDAASLGFEQAYRELDEIVARLEADDMTLDASLALYERGVALSRRCADLLAAADLRVREVDGRGRDAGPVELDQR